MPHSSDDCYPLLHYSTTPLLHWTIYYNKLNTTLKTQYAMQHKCNATQMQCNTNGPSVIRDQQWVKWKVVYIKRYLLKKNPTHPGI